VIVSTKYLIIPPLILATQAICLNFDRCCANGNGVNTPQVQTNSRPKNEPDCSGSTIPIRTSLTRALVRNVASRAGRPGRAHAGVDDSPGFPKTLEKGWQQFFEIV